MAERIDNDVERMERQMRRPRRGRILLLLGQRENRRLLGEWLEGMQYEVKVGESAEALAGAFDLCIVDGPMLEGLADWVQAVKRARRPVLVPFLLVTHRQDVGMATQHLWRSVDELIVSPAEKGELRARVEALLTARELSLANTLLSRQLEAELARAGRVQAELLPKWPPKLDGFEVAGRCIPAREVGGDFYDWQEIGEGRLSIAVGDVMGKGMSAALLMATVRATLRAVVGLNGPADAVELVRQALEADLVRTDRFVTLYVGCLNPARKRMRYVDAGHGWVFMRRGGGGVEMLKQGGRPVGVPSERGYEEGEIEFKAGEALVVYSDGLVEIGEEGRVEPEVLSRQMEGAKSAGEMVERLVESAKLEGSPPDDLTVVVVRAES